MISAEKVTADRIWVRDHEVCLRIVNPNAGHCSRPGCGKQLAVALCAWDHRITSGRSGDWQLGEDAFTVARHADGTHHDDTDLVSLFAITSCPQCGTENSLHTVQEAYCDKTTCDRCTYHSTYMIGD